MKLTLTSVLLALPAAVLAKPSVKIHAGTLDGVKIRPQSTTRQSPLLNLRLENCDSRHRNLTANTLMESLTQLRRPTHAFSSVTRLSQAECMMKTGKPSLNLSLSLC